MPARSGQTNSHAVPGYCVPVPRRFDAGRILVALGAITLLVSLFLDWFEAEDEFAFGDGVSAWTVFEIVDLLLAALAVAALVAAVEALIRPAGRTSLPPALARVAGPAALVLVVAALLNHPPAAIGQSIEEGGWIALAGALLMTLGALLGFARIALVVAPREPGPAAGSPAAGPGGSVAQAPVATPGQVQAEPPTQPLPPDPPQPR